ncbi:NRPS-like enzyme [Penicillium longicatenatum]|uniref:NRPS-like enzyme n=1 Tax=Penicillium longicatenatum TaxID=1561947 RepID=UPI0025472AC1|nr:NRPS-like enzyme [Penicillium longicatenatum]KAJ5636075.1 NRPS-like enzyme [Penicillium longicatenatum]
MVGVSQATFKPSNKLLAAEVDFLAKSDPGRRFGLIPKSNRIEDGFREISFLELSRAVNATSWWIEKQIGRPKKRETIAYMGNNDARYILFMLASHKLGYTAHVLHATESSKLLFSHEKLHRILELKECMALNTVEVPSVIEILDDVRGLDHYLFEKSYGEIEDENAFMIHSSGTTGMPKPVPLTHGFLGAWSNAPHIPRPDDRQPSFFNHLGPDHLSRQAIVGGLACRYIARGKAYCNYPAPFYPREGGQSEEALECIRTLDFICFGGAPLAPEIGKKLSQYTELRTYHGRLDDVIVLSNGEKLNPVTLEKMVEDHPSVHRALLIGQGRFQSALLVEPTQGAKLVDEEKLFIESIWPQVEKANEMVPNYGRVMKNMIRLSSPEKPFKLTSKGTTQRHAMNKNYSQEADDLYAAQDDQLEMQLPSPVDLESMKEYLHKVISLLSGESNLGNGDDLYSIGMDSLRTIQLSKLLKTANIYAHSTVDRLAGMMMRGLAGEAATTTRISRTEKIANLISKYTSDLPIRSVKPSQPAEASTMILTGSTGSLGTYLLHSLLNQRNAESFQSKGLPASPLFDSNKVEFLHVSFGESQFGLPSAKYQSFLERVDLIIHNAWKVNFNHKVESFEHPHLFGMREFVNLSINGRHNAHIAFISSVSTVGGWVSDTMGPVVPEVPMTSIEQVLEQGYGESKFVGESICVEASRKAGVPTSIFRWIPTLVATSKAMGRVPAELGGYAIDWVSVNALADFALEILQTRRSALSEEFNAVFHLTNLNRSKWSSLIPTAQEKYPVQMVSLEDWLDELEEIKDPSEQEVLGKPALKMLQFYRGLTTDSTLSAEISVTQASKTMAMLGPVSPAQMSNWINQWGF